ncbi:SecDF P1 head subdomain-containing protein [Fodinibius sp. AD559]|uniref:SecDF P1 head subdomain-containing protein n=1 Tax=Fodinibius sp. AD559 TaxID=3424179 RepID=UPI004046C2C7
MRIEEILLGISLFIGFFAISCETKSSDSDSERQQSINNIGQGAIIDTTNMDEIQGVPVMQAPGAQIDRDKVTAMLNEEKLSFQEITNPNATAEDIEESVAELKILFSTDRVRNDEELEFFVHTILNNSYLRLYQKTGEDEHLSQTEKHVDMAISLFKDQPEYKADLVDAYTGQLAVYSLKGKNEEAMSLLKKLIEEYQNIGYGLYKNWFASRQVEKMYNMIRMDSLNSQKVQETVDYLTKVSEKYENEVGITAQMVLAEHYATRGEQERVNRLINSIEERLSFLDNQEFKGEKWKRYRTQIKSIQKREGQEVSKADRDTLFYEITPEMIDQARIHEVNQNGNQYRVIVQLKEEHHSDYAQKTTDNIGNFLAVVYNGEIISSSFPTIQTGISNGRFSLGSYEKKSKAEEVLNRLKNE